MNRLILLDSEPVGLCSNPRKVDRGGLCKEWLQARLRDGDRVMIPEIIDYEVRRELLRAGKSRGIAWLDALGGELGLLPSGGDVLLEAAELWARARRDGYPTADAKALDVDVILAASAILASRDGHDVIVATSNEGHLARFVAARSWETIV